MNLIQIQEHLKDLPVQVIQSYANGANPEVPPYMALAEMQRRQTMEQRAGQQQQAQQGPMPTVKEQIEQSAGLAGLQAKQAQQAQAQQQAPQGGPVPGGIPQPQAQPQAPSPEQQGIGAPPQPQPQQPQRMAEGGMTTASQGIENLQVPMGMFEYAEGGILGYAGDEPQGSVVRDPDEEKKMKIMQILNGYKQEEPKPSAPASDSNANQPQRPARPASTETRPSRNQDPNDFLTDPDYTAAIKRSIAAAKSPEENVAAMKAAREAAGVTGNYGEEQQKRLDEEEKQYQDMIKNRGFNNFLNVMSGIGQGGLGGAAPAYLQQTAAQEAADIAQKRRLNAARGDIEAKQREENLGLGTEAYKSSEAQRNTATEASGRMASQQIQAAANAQQEAARYAHELELAKERNASAQELEALRYQHDESIHKADRTAQMAYAKFNAEAPTAEMKDFENYFKNIYSKDPANQKMVGNRATGYKGVVDDTLRAKAFIKYSEDKYAGQASIWGGPGGRAETMMGIQEGKNEAQNVQLQQAIRNLANEVAKGDGADPVKINNLRTKINVLKNPTAALNGGISQGASSTDLSAPPPGAVRLKQ
jgi:hypothetical protein